MDENGKEILKIKGDWLQFLQFFDLKQTIVAEGKFVPLPENFERYYNFTKISLNLNNLTPDLLLKLPPTDARFRTDQRAYEYGDLDLAASEKHRLEENQRARRKIE